jgi:hypothetical protein
MASDEGRSVGAERKRARLAAALRENLRRRKLQKRARADDSPKAGEADAVADGPAPGRDEGT